MTFRVANKVTIIGASGKEATYTKNAYWDAAKDRVAVGKSVLDKIQEPTHAVATPSSGFSTVSGEIVSQDSDDTHIIYKLDL